MKIYVGSLDNPGDHLSRDLAVDDVAFERRGSAVAVDPGATMSFDVYHAGDHWAVHGSGNLAVTTVCDRCLKEAHVKLQIDFSVEIFRGRAGEHESEAAEEGKIPQIDDEQYMELGPRVREEIIMAMPVKVLCQGDCEGLCPVCGQDLNQGSCDCSTDFVDPRLESLAKLKEEMKDSEQQQRF